MTIDMIRDKCIDETIEVTGHVLLRMQQRGISYSDIKNAVMTGDIIEDYPDDFPYPSALVLGTTESGKNLHVVVGVSDTRLWFITVYYPDTEEWEEDLRRRKNG